MRRILFVCLLAVTSAAVVPAVASAGTYVDYECAGPDGQQRLAGLALNNHNHDQ